MHRACYLPVQALGSSLSDYRDRRFSGSDEEYYERLRTSTTVYVGNLSFQTTEFQMYEVRQPAAMPWLLMQQHLPC